MATKQLKSTAPEFEIGQRVMAKWGDENDNEYGQFFWGTVAKYALSGAYVIKFDDGSKGETLEAYVPSLATELADVFNGTRLEANKAERGVQRISLPKVPARVDLEMVKSKIKQACVNAGFKSQGKGMFPDLSDETPCFYVERMEFKGAIEPTQIGVMLQGTAAEPVLALYF